MQVVKDQRPSVEIDLDPARRVKASIRPGEGRCLQGAAPALRHTDARGAEPALGQKLVNMRQWQQQSKAPWVSSPN